MNLFTLKNVKKSYGRGEAAVHALNGLNLEIGEGAFAAITGRSGSGKSTLMHLLQRLYDVDEGRGAIRIGGTDIRRIRKSHLRSRIGLILQEPFLYSRTVKDNIGIAVREPSDENGSLKARCPSDPMPPMNRSMPPAFSIRAS